MIWGSGPGRGVPWWRRYGIRSYLILHRCGRLEPVGARREGRTVAVLGRFDT